jgi:hypothetical protein
MPPFMLLGDNAIGTIQAGDDQQERLDEITQRLSAGEFHTATAATMPFMCIDGRPGSELLAPNSAGGTISLYVADDLTTQRVGKGLSTAEGLDAIVDYVLQQGAAIGGHTDDHAHDQASGCGANDKLAAIYNFIANNGKQLRTVAAAIGVEPDRATRKHIIHHAKQRDQFSVGAELLQTLQQKAPQENVVRLHGDHNEVIAVINKRVGTTLDREKLAAEFGPNYQAFNVDVWSFEEAARNISFNESEVLQKITALVYYNLATAHVLCGPSMRVIVLE